MARWLETVTSSARTARAAWSWTDSEAASLASLAILSAAAVALSLNRPAARSRTWERISWTWSRTSGDLDQV